LLNSFIYSATASLLYQTGKMTFGVFSGKKE